MEQFIMAGNRNKYFPYICNTASCSLTSTLYSCFIPTGSVKPFPKPGLLIPTILLLLFSNTRIQAQVFTDSNLPIILIQTDNNANIPDEPGVLGNMKIIYRGPGLRNYLTDQDSFQYLNYDGRIDIELRGSYSQTFPKKAYGLSTLLPDNVTNNNVSLLGMPSENDWVLNSLSSDPSLLRDYLSYTLASYTGQYASRTRFCEVMVNGNYRGLYLLQEKIKPDKNRVNILEIEIGQNTLPELSGGYITKTDKTTGGDPIAWYMSSYSGFNDCQFIHHWPKPTEVSSQQSNYIKSVFTGLQSVCSAGNSSVTNGYPTYIDIPSFVDFMLINELASNVDAYTYSTFYHKDRNGKLRAGPIWDHNLTYGNDLFNMGVDRSKPDVWQFWNNNNEGPKYYRDLYNNANFRCYLARRWNQLTQSGAPWNLSNITALIDTTVVHIQEAMLREDQRWGTIGNYTGEITNLKSWLGLRIPWMTTHLGSYTGCQNITIPPLVISKINYHPGISVSFPDDDKLEFIEITNAGLQTLDLSGIYFSAPGLGYQFPSGAQLPAGTAVYLASDLFSFQNRYGLTAFGQYGRNLSNSNQNLVLSDAFGNEIDQVHYYDDLPWPDADGNGKYLQLISVSLDNSLASSWVAMSDNTVGINSLQKTMVLRACPNPTRDVTVLHSPFPIQTLEVMDIQGRILALFGEVSAPFRIDFSGYPAGIYLIKATAENGVYYEKIIRE